FYTGPGADLVAAGKRVIAQLGGDASSVASMDTFRAQANKVVLDAIGGSLGNQISNSDRDFIVGQAPNLSLSAEGNRRLLTIMERLARRNIEAANFLDSYVAQNGTVDEGFYSALRRWREDNPLFTPEEMEAWRQTPVQAAQQPSSTQTEGT